MRKLFFIVSLLSLVLSCGKASEPVLENDCLRLAFSPESGALVSLYNVKEGVEHLDSAKAAVQPLWAFEYMPGQAPAENLPEVVSFKKLDKRTLQIIWSQAPGVSGPEIKAIVRLKKDRPSLAEWYLEAEGLDSLGVMSIRFPVIGGILPQGENDVFAMGAYTGRLYNNPWALATEEKPFIASRATGYQAMQVNVLYNSDSDGLYYGTEDPDAWYKTFNFTAYPDRGVIHMTHWLRLDMDAHAYKTPYPTIIGVFKGDWIDAGQLYAQWGLKQRWCAESRLKNGLVPQWTVNTALWEWNRGRSENVLTEAMALQEHLGLPVSVFWHWWHNCSYDDGFPDYLPPREGRESFIKAVAKAREKGIHCINYMNSFQWGSSAPSWDEKHAADWCVRTADRGTITKTYNKWTGRSLTNMCPWTEFWRKTYSDMCDTLVNVYGTGGIYLDQSCQSKPCYSTTHGHPVGGGSTFVDGHLKLYEDVRKAISSYPYDAPALGGEYASEYWMGHMDLGLPLQAGDERMGGGTSYEIIPFFPSVYHEYQLCYGNFSMLVSPPYDEKWPQEFRPADTETLLPDDFDRQFMMEQARTFVWGIQPCIANFHEYLFEKKPQAMDFLLDMARTRYKALDFLVYGTFRRCPEMPIYNAEIVMSRLNTYALGEDRVKRFSKVEPTLYSGAWQAPDGRLGIALANIADETREFDFILDPIQYGLASNGEISIITANGDSSLLQSYEGRTSVHIVIPARSTMIIVTE